MLGGIFNTYPGGKGAKQAFAAFRRCAKVTIIGCVGDDSFGREMLKTLSAEKIDTSQVLVNPKVATGVALIQIDEQAQNSNAVVRCQLLPDQRLS